MVRFRAVGATQRGGEVRAQPVPDPAKETLQAFVADIVDAESTVYTDDNNSYRGLVDTEHEAVRHSVGEYVRDHAHTNRIESFLGYAKS